MNNRFVVIIAGGKGERFWPQSRSKKPKHLLPIVGKSCMIAQTIDRVQPIVGWENVIIITNKEHAEAIYQASPQLFPKNIIAEPMGKDTAMAIGLATILIHKRCPDAIIAVIAADQAIHDIDTYQKTLHHAFDIAQNNPVIVTLGIKPTFPSTGYGYIQQGSLFRQTDSFKAYGVKRFVEKPNVLLAQKYLESGDYYWNTGSFIAKSITLLKAFSSLAPDIYDSLVTIETGLDNGESLPTILEKVYPNLKKISIDYAIMEKSRNIILIPSYFDWDDVGSWPALERHYSPDSEGNITQGKTISYQATSNIIIGGNEHLVGVVGIDNFIIIHTPDATLICPKHKSEDIKQLVKKIELNKDYTQWL